MWMIAFIVLGACGGIALLWSVWLHHRREVLRINRHYAMPDYQRGLVDGLQQAQGIVRGLAFLYEFQRANTVNAINGAMLVAGKASGE
jgi:hypothetical protein